jgi:hypothetical protein
MKTGEVYFMTNLPQDNNMVIEYHLQRPSIGVFLWTVIRDSLGGSVKKTDQAFEQTRVTFHREYVLPLGQALGYDGVLHVKHFEQDWFSPYHLTKGYKKIFPVIKGHDRSPIEENKYNWDTIRKLETRIDQASKDVVASLYKACNK